eukprot:scaffold9928_cov63-Phaeocystis_antarctica.AAC.2
MRGERADGQAGRACARMTRSPTHSAARPRRAVVQGGVLTPWAHGWPTCQKRALAARPPAAQPPADRPPAARLARLIVASIAAPSRPTSRRACRRRTKLPAVENRAAGGITIQLNRIFNRSPWEFEDRPWPVRTALLSCSLATCRPSCRRTKLQLRAAGAARSAR